MVIVSYNDKLFAEMPLNDILKKDRIFFLAE